MANEMAMRQEMVEEFGESPTVEIRPLELGVPVIGDDSQHPMYLGPVPSERDDMPTLRLTVLGSEVGK